MTICCCCCEENDYYNDIITTKSEAGNRSTVGGVLEQSPSAQRMERAFAFQGTTLVTQKKQPSRSNESVSCIRQPRPVELSEAAAASWERHATSMSVRGASTAWSNPTESTDTVQKDPMTSVQISKDNELAMGASGENRGGDPQPRGVTSLDDSVEDEFDTSTSWEAPHDFPPAPSANQESPTRPFRDEGLISLQDELDAIVMFLNNRDTNRSPSTTRTMAAKIQSEQDQEFESVDPFHPMDLEKHHGLVTDTRGSIVDTKELQNQNVGEQTRRKHHALQMTSPRNSNGLKASYPLKPSASGLPLKPSASGLKAIPEALSDVGSEVDSDARERYLYACRLLKSALIERESVLLPNERVFLHDLLNNTQHSPTEAQMHAIRTASATLISDPLFQLGPTSETEKEHRFLSQPSQETEASVLSASKLRRLSSSHVSSLPSLMDEEATDVGTLVSSTAMTYRMEENVAIDLASVARFDGREYPFYVLGVTPDSKVGVLTPSLMESLRSFFPSCIADQNFWLKYSLQRDGASIPVLLSKVRTSKYTVLGVETKDGHVFGAFCSSAWRAQPFWYGNSECFLWRLKRSRYDRNKRRTFKFDNEMEVYPCTGKDDMIQYCSKSSIALGGGEFTSHESPFPNEPAGIGFMIDGDLQGGETNACATFNNPRLASRSPTRGNEFEILNLEIWTITPCVTVPDAEKTEMHQHFVEEFDREH